MLSLQWKLRQRMIEGRLAPCVRGMTKLAAAFRYPVIQLPLMGIRMTTPAGEIGETEADLTLLYRIGGVTCEARNGLVTSRESVARTAVLLQSKQSGSESIGRMTLFAGSAALAMGELTFVNIVMTIGTPFVRDPVGHFPASVAVRTFDLSMSSQKRKRGS